MKTTIILMLLSFSTLSADIKLESTNNQTQVIELYTSEGCSSCPPADKYLSGLKQSPQLFKTFVPIALHVDYWDYIGWKDKLALQKNATRQQIYKILGNLNSVYTPGMLKAGKEWRAWRFANIKSSPLKVGKLTVQVKDNHITAQFDAKKASYNLNIALLGMNIKSKVRAGENKGKILKHDFVLLKQEMVSSQSPAWDFELPNDFLQSKYPDKVFVVWIEGEMNPAPLQAVATYL